MFDALRVAVLIAAYNEATQIAGVISSVPDYVSHIVVVNDASTDSTAAVVREVGTVDQRVQLIDLPENKGVGGALAVAYAWARDHDVDVAVTVDGDGQMDADEIADLIAPIADGIADYTKGNRLHDPSAWRVIPPVRLAGNAVLSLLTKAASGYWAVADSQSGFTAAGRFALERVDWESMYPRYGRPNDVLVLANVADCRVADVPITAIYGVGEKSSMKILRVIFAISWLLFRRFWWRMFHKYLLRDFHPLLFFYLLATATAVIGFGLTVRLFWLWAANGFVPPMTALATAFVAITSLNALFFANWMDMQANEHLAVKLTSRAPVERKADRSPPTDAG